MLQKRKTALHRQKVKNHHKAIRAAFAKASFMAEVEDPRKQLQSQKSVAIEEALSSLPSIQRPAFQTSLEQVKAKGPRGVRYARVWVMNCLLLHTTSQRKYNLLQNTKLLPLPTTSRLNQPHRWAEPGQRSLARMWFSVNCSLRSKCSLHQPMCCIPDLHANVLCFWLHERLPERCEVATPLLCFQRSDASLGAIQSNSAYQPGS